MAAKKTSGGARGGKPKANVRAKPPEVDLDDDEEDDDEEEGEDESRFFALIDTRTHVPITHEAHYGLINAKQSLDEADTRRIQADSQRADSLFSGFSTNVTYLQQQLADAHRYGNEQRDHADRMSRKATDAEYAMAQLVRQSEDAKLERERLAAQIRQMEIAKERLEAELEHKRAQRKDELEAVSKAAAPVFAAAGQGVAMLMAHYGGKIPGMGGGLPAGSAGPTANGASNGAPVNGQANGKANGHVNGANAVNGVNVQPTIRVSVDDTEEWKTAFLDVFGKLGRDSLACLRALACSNLIPNAPAVPTMVKDNFVSLVMTDAGDEKVMTFLRTSAMAYVEEPTVQPQAPANAPGAPN